MSDLPRRAVSRTAKLATLPVGLAGRTALGLGKRLGGRPAEIVAQEIQQRTAEQIFRVLGELKGGALKLGQALSIFEAALPPEIAGPYRATLTRLQESAPPLPAATVHRVLAADLGPDWRDRFAAFDDQPAAAASIGQVHRAVWLDGRQVAVKIQYPGAGKALISDFTQLSRIGRLFGVLMPGLEVRPLLDELRARVAEELDYRLEASSQQAFATAYAGDPEIFVPPVVSAYRSRADHRVDGRHSAIQDHFRRDQGAAEPRGHPAGPVPVLRPGQGPAARRSASGKLPAAGRRQARGARLRCRGPAAGWIPRGARQAAVADAHRRRHRDRRAGAAAARVPARGSQRRPGRPARLPGAAGRAVQVRQLPVQPGVDARPGRRDHRRSLGQRGPPAEPAALLRADSPGIHGRHRGAVPA